MTIITSLALVAGVPQHVTIVDQANSNAPLPPSSITWVAFGGANVSMITADATGFIFLAPGAFSGAFQATYHSGGAAIQLASLNATATSAVQPAYASP